MAVSNMSVVTEFIFLGLTDSPELQVPLFVIFLVIYLITLTGNLGMVVLIKTDPRLHTPMYFFLSYLSLTDFCYSSAIAPKMLLGFLSQSKVISFNSCGAQFFFFSSSVGIECLLLAMMAYDRYVAICNPLLYTVVMSQRVCLQLVVGSFLAGFVNSTIHTISIFQLSFCASNVINHFFCDVPPLLKLSCADTFVNEVVIFTFASLIEMSCLIAILISYVYIVSAILRTRSAKARHKTFSTCGSHLTAVIVFFGTTLFIYLQPSSNHHMDQDKVVSLFYTVVIPMLNPLIYSLRNKEVKDSLRRRFGRKIFS
ncbi:olfactory receptor 1020-like isoform X2 [Alligator sinensis]|uniref:Olfactory receptor n=1 Tax=Alligator sinensis TaxID=38654 RepID=A0A3Q0HCC2_ALLSI|nr:olfactory receptor 1020-like isoform X2 [Alligator sinensis]